MLFSFCRYRGRYLGLVRPPKWMSWNLVWILMFNQGQFLMIMVTPLHFTFIINFYVFSSPEVTFFDNLHTRYAINMQIAIQFSHMLHYLSRVNKTCVICYILLLGKDSSTTRRTNFILLALSLARRWERSNRSFLEKHCSFHLLANSTSDLNLGLQIVLILES